MTMKLKVSHLMDATLVINAIASENRPMPQKGKYRIARMSAKLTAEFEIINRKRNEMITAYNTPQMMPNPAYKEGAVVEGTNVVELPPRFIPSPTEFMVPADKLAEFTAAWAEIAAEEIEVNVEPIPLGQLCLEGNDKDGSITAQELTILGDLVSE